MFPTINFSFNLITSFSITSFSFALLVNSLPSSLVFSVSFLNHLSNSSLLTLPLPASLSSSFSSSDSASPSSASFAALTKSPASF
jgi:hypothetical protein